MYEGDASAVKADARLGVDQLEACRTGRQERGGDVGDAVRDMVKARSALGDELSHRRVLPQRRHELDLALADAQERCFETFMLAGGAMHELRAQRAFIQADRFIEVRDGDADVVDAIRRAQYLYQPSPVLRPSFPALTFASS